MIAPKTKSIAPTRIMMKVIGRNYTAACLALDGISPGATGDFTPPAALLIYDPRGSEKRSKKTMRNPSFSGLSTAGGGVTLCTGKQVEHPAGLARRLPDNTPNHSRRTHIAWLPHTTPLTLPWTNSHWQAGLISSSVSPFNPS